MIRPVATIQCMHVIAQVSLGFYDAEGNLLREEPFPQSDGRAIVAKLFYPHGEQLASLIATCIDQAWAKLNAEAQTERRPPVRDGCEAAVEDERAIEPAASSPADNA